MTTATTTKRSWKTTGTELLSDEGRKVAFRSCGGRCPVCGKKVSRHGRREDQLTVDHVVAHAAGGDDSVDNMVVLCGACNYSKKERSFAEWLPAYLIKIERATTLRGARRSLGRYLTKIEASGTKLAADLRAAGIEK